MKRSIAKSLFSMAFLGICFASCARQEALPSLRILNAKPVAVLVDQSVLIQCLTENLEGDVQFRVENERYAEVDAFGLLSGKKAGTTRLFASSGSACDEAVVQVLDPNMRLGAWGMLPEKETCRVGDRIEVLPYIEAEEWRYLYEEMEPFLFDDVFACLEGRTLIAKAPGTALLNQASDYQRLTILE